MEIRQLKTLVTLSETHFSVSKTAERLHLVQSAISQQISRLENELGLPLFERQGKRLTGFTPAGEEICRYAYRTLASVKDIGEISREYLKREAGALRVGATHAQARYVLPRVIKRFRDEYPESEIQIQQGTPPQLMDRLFQNIVDLCICTEALENNPELVVMRAYQWNRVLICPPDHPMAGKDPITLKRLAREPMITYIHGFTGRGVFDETFSARGLTPNVVIGAADTDVIKAYVREGLGVGVIATMACMSGEDPDLVYRDLSHIFPGEVTKISYQKNRYLGKAQLRFIELFQEHVNGLVGYSLPESGT